MSKDKKLTEEEMKKASGAGPGFRRRPGETQPADDTTDGGQNVQIDQAPPQMGFAGGVRAAGASQVPGDAPNRIDEADLQQAGGRGGARGVNPSEVPGDGGDDTREVPGIRAEEI